MEATGISPVSARALTNGKDVLEVELTGAEFQAVGTVLMDPEEDWILASGRRSSGGIRLWASFEQMEGLLGWIASEANDIQPSARRRLLESALDRLDPALCPPRPEE
jgi:hypothetical protein